MFDTGIRYRIRWYPVVFQIAVLACYLPMYSQQPDRELWHAFSDESKELVGFKTGQDEIRIPAVFPAFAVAARKFEDIIGIIEATPDRTFNSYYLLKSGKKVATDSVYFYDNIQDCESEGTIRFQDPITKKIGFLDKFGKVRIDAEYNWASKFKNGMSFAIKNAEKQCLDPSCEHWTWVGGDSMVINKMNDVLIRNIRDMLNLDRYRMTELDAATADTTKMYMPSERATVFAFEKYEAAFWQWFEHISGKISTDEVLYQEITFWDQKAETWKTINQTDFTSKYNSTIVPIIAMVQKNEVPYFITRNELNPFIFNDEKYEPFFDNCGAPLGDKYPVMGIVINHRNEKGELYQDHLDFLRTDDGYRLISFTIH